MQGDQNTIFISYRRTAAAFIARAIFLDLRAHNYDVFMDVESLDSGQFEQIIFSQIDSRMHFLVILTPGTVERFSQKKDVMRHEIEYAIDRQRNIVPLLANKFEFNIDTNKYLTGKLTTLPTYSGIEVPHEYFDAAMERLRTRFLKQAFPASAEIKPIIATAQSVEQQIPDQEPQLSAKEYFNRALNKQNLSDLDGAIADYDQALRLDAKYVEAFNRRGLARINKGDLSGAIADFNNALQVSAADEDSGYEARIVLNQLEDLQDYDRITYTLAVGREAAGDFEGAMRGYGMLLHQLRSDQVGIRARLEQRIQDLQNQLGGAS